MQSENCAIAYFTKDIIECRHLGNKKGTGRSIRLRHNGHNVTGRKRALVDWIARELKRGRSNLFIHTYVILVSTYEIWKWLKHISALLVTRRRNRKSIFRHISRYNFVLDHTQFFAYVAGSKLTGALSAEFSTLVLNFSWMPCPCPSCSVQSVWRVLCIYSVGRSCYVRRSSTLYRVH